ncbi:family 43 glycosylhydrolase [Pedobacter sp. JCM 36344]|uniref:family 43 glycosylhydrolase n=1 Tax=Pedobacter sp. JCM 36344 TaxID=3374280 RepID=UPI00397B4036
MLNKLIKFLLLTTICSVNSSMSQDLRRDIRAHDPAIIKKGNSYYLYCTGKGIKVWSSVDRVNWKSEPSVFSVSPQWAVDAVPGFDGFIWAPDISFFNGKYYLYYSVSTFGKNTSAIGVATNLTLDRSDLTYKWIDHGMVIQSIAGMTNWNAIDPNIITDSDGTPYLSFGSFWDGLKLVKLSANRLKVEGSLLNLPTIASRGNRINAIEAPFIFKKGRYFYLFASIGFCCRGKESTYKIIVGRAEKVSGPFLDDKGKSLTAGGGRLVLQGNKDWYGVGHNAVANFNRKDYLIFHGYSASENGAPKLLIRTLRWRSGWPVSSAL